MKKNMQKKYTLPQYHHELMRIVYHLIVVIAVFILVYVCINFTSAAYQNPTIIYTESATQDSSKQSPITYESLSSLTYKLVLLQIKIGTSKGNLDLLKLNIENDILETTNDAEMLVREDIIQALKNTNKKANIFNTYAQNMDTTINKANFFIMILDQDVNTSMTKMNACIEEKKLSDQEYFNSINYYDQQAMVASLKKSTIYNACIAQARLEVNAKTAIVSKLKFYYDLLKLKYDFLLKNQEAILNNINVLDAKILQELSDINTTLNSYAF